MKRKLERGLAVLCSACVLRGSMSIVMGGSGALRAVPCYGAVGLCG